MQYFYDRLGEAWSVTRQADPNHLGRTRIRQMRKAVSSKDMFPHCTTSQARKQATTAFAKDLKSRCSNVIEKLWQHGHGDITKCINRLPDVCTATIECYSGNCSFLPPWLSCLFGCTWFQRLVVSVRVHSNAWHSPPEINREWQDPVKNYFGSPLQWASSIQCCVKCKHTEMWSFQPRYTSLLAKRNKLSKYFWWKTRLQNFTDKQHNQGHCTSQGYNNDRPETFKKGESQLVRVQQTWRKAIQMSPVFKAKWRSRRARLENEYAHARSNTIVRDDGYSKGQLDKRYFNIIEKKDDDTDYAWT